MPVMVRRFCGAKRRFFGHPQEDPDERDDGIRDRGRRHIADLLSADEPGAEPKRAKQPGWRQLGRRGEL